MGLTSEPVLAEMRSMHAELLSKIQIIGNEVRLQIENVRNDMSGLRSKLKEHMEGTEVRLDELRTVMESMKVGCESIHVVKGSMSTMVLTMNRMKADTDSMNVSVRNMETAVKAFTERVDRTLEQQAKEERIRSRRRFDYDVSRSSSVSDECEKESGRDDEQPAVQAPNVKCESHSGHRCAHSAHVDCDGGGGADDDDSGHTQDSYVAEAYDTTIQRRERSGSNKNGAEQERKWPVFERCTQRGFLGLILVRRRNGGAWPQLIYGKTQPRGLDFLSLGTTLIDKDINFEKCGERAWIVLILSGNSVVSFGIFPTFQLAQARICELKKYPDHLTKKDIQLGGCFQIWPAKLVVQPHAYISRSDNT